MGIKLNPKNEENAVDEVINSAVESEKQSPDVNSDGIDMSSLKDNTSHKIEEPAFVKNEEVVEKRKYFQNKKANIALIVISAVLIITFLVLKYLVFV